DEEVGCFPNVCKNDGNCSIETSTGMTRCQCLEGYTGHVCENPL
uniref:Augerpeptide hhe9.2 n=1 Tax=Hastula hectica TaxID=745793 RepID=TE92_HASHE|nr:RecName: Full=Augerpeptide hhe9.2 [Hastula hectica]